MGNPKGRFFERSVSEQSGVWLVSSLLVFAIIWFVFLAPRISEQQELQNSLELREEASRQEHQVRQHLESLEKLHAESLQAHEELKTGLATSSELEMSLASISQAAQASNVSVRSVERQKEISRDFFIEVPLRVSVYGSYPQLLEFLQKVASIDTLLVLNRLDLNNPSTQEGRVLLFADCYFAAYRPKDVADSHTLGKR